MPSARLEHNKYQLYKSIGLTRLRCELPTLRMRSLHSNQFGHRVWPPGFPVSLLGGFADGCLFVNGDPGFFLLLSCRGQEVGALFPFVLIRSYTSGCVVRYLKSTPLYRILMFGYNLGSAPLGDLHLNVVRGGAGSVGGLI